MGKGLDTVSGWGNKLFVAPTKKWIVNPTKKFFGGVGDFGEKMLDKVNPVEIAADWGYQLKFQSPFAQAKTEYGGQAVFLKNQPRALKRAIVARMTNPPGGSPTIVDAHMSSPAIEVGTTSPPYSSLKP